MRIITGKAKGIILKAPAGDLTRPTADRVKEAVFSMLQFDIEERSILDLFAGSGQMGLEALSRGAREATFVDKSKDAIKLIRENAEKSKLSDSALIFQADYIEFLQKNIGKSYDIIFLDPPYAANMYKPALKKLLDNGYIKPSTFIICESDFNELFENDIELESKFTIKKQSKYSKTVITILGLKNEDWLWKKISQLFREALTQ